MEVVACLVCAIDNWKCWDTWLNTNKPTLVILIVRHFSFFFFLLRICTSPYLEQLCEELDLRLLNHWATAFQIQLLFPCSIPWVILAKVVMKLQKYKQFCFSDISLLVELSVWQVNCSSISESRHPNKVYETLGAYDDCFFQLCIHSRLYSPVLNCTTT